MDIKYSNPEIFPKSLDVKKKWFVAFRATNPDTGVRKQFQYRGDINTIRNKKERYRESVALRNALLEMLRKGWNPFSNDFEKKHGTITDLLDYSLELKKSTIKPKSYRGYNDIVKIFKKWLSDKGISFIDVKEFKYSNAQSYADYLLIERKYAGKTFNNHIGAIKSLFNVFIDREIIEINPFGKIKKRPCDLGKNYAFTEIERNNLISRLKKEDINLYCFVMFMYHTFIRRAELTMLKIGNISLENKSIIVNSENSKNRRQQSVAIPRGLVPVIEMMKLHEYPSDYYVFGIGLKPNSKHYKKPDSITDRHKKHLISLGIPSDKTLYSWKHTGVCDYWQAIKDPYVLMRQLRHHDLSITMIYLKSLGLTPNSAFIDADIRL